MSASLVGSEMCIRDRRWVFEHSQQANLPRQAAPFRHRSLPAHGRTETAVSYTHLTLPTICSV
eukprot:6903158-Alexandrium_andersonii.AAC.1